MKLNKVKIFGIQMNKKTAVRWKIYLDRAKMYLNYINFVMIVFVFLNSINDSRIREVLDENKIVFYPLVMVLFISLSLVLGFFDTKLGLRKEEMRNNSTENPVMMEVLNHLKEIKSNQQSL